MKSRVPDRWKQRVGQHIRQSTGEERDEPSASDFQRHIQVRFPDGSFVFIRNAFYLLDVAEGEIALFSEHCGYLVFPFGDASVEAFSSEGIDVG